jgi:DNA repair exonuclease SbcCD ATPase subunit
VTAKHTPVRRGADALGALLLGPLLAGAALAAVSSASHAGGGTRSWWRRGDNLRADAQAAKDAAAQAFYELDTAQRDLRISLETIAAVDNSPPARRAAADFAALSQRIDEVSNTYITAVDAHDLDREELEASAAARAREDLTKARDELLRVKADLERFAQNLGPLLSKAEEQLARVAPAVERARQALLRATNALDGVRAAGLRADDLAARLAALAPELTKLHQGAATHGVQETLRRAEEVAATAERLGTEAAGLPERAKEIDLRLSSLRTRVDALANRIGTLDPVLSELRRRFSAACWQDLQNVPAQTQHAVEQARTKLAEATRARDEQRWPDATSRLGTVRALLNTADEGVSAAGKRLDLLNEVARDPKAEIERTRFALRDAQRLAMAGRATPDPKHARPLDDAVGRIDRATAALDGRHPDYWHFLTEMAAVRETAGRVVAAIREERAAGG